MLRLCKPKVGAGETAVGMNFQFRIKTNRIEPLPDITSAAILRASIKCHHTLFQYPAIR